MNELRLPPPPVRDPWPSDIPKVTPVTSKTSQHQAPPTVGQIQHFVACPSLAAELAATLEPVLDSLSAEFGHPIVGDVAASEVQRLLNGWEDNLLAYHELNVQSHFLSTVLPACQRLVKEADAAFNVQRADQPGRMSGTIENTTRGDGSIYRADYILYRGRQPVILLEYKNPTASFLPGQTSQKSQGGIFVKLHGKLSGGGTMRQEDLVKEERSLLTKAVYSSDRYGLPFSIVLDGRSYFVVARSTSTPSTVLVSPLLSLDTEGQNFLRIILSPYFSSDPFSPALQRASAATTITVTDAPTLSPPQFGCLPSSNPSTSGHKYTLRSSGRLGKSETAQELATTVFVYPDGCYLTVVDSTKALLPPRRPRRSDESTTSTSSLPSASFSPSPTPPQTPLSTPTSKSTSLSPVTIHLQSLASPSSASSPKGLSITTTPPAITTSSSAISTSPPSVVQLTSLLASGGTSRVWSTSDAKTVVKISRFGEAASLEREARFLLGHSSLYEGEDPLTIRPLAFYREVSGGRQGEKEIEEVGPEGEEEEDVKSTGKVALVMVRGGRSAETWEDWAVEDRVHLFVSLARLHLDHGVIHGDAEPRNTLKPLPSLFNTDPKPLWIDFGRSVSDHVCPGWGCEELEEVQKEMEFREDEEDLLEAGLKAAGLVQ